jgi:hypothetical protein
MSLYRILALHKRCGIVYRRFFAAGEVLLNERPGFYQRE